jgi:uncharacterized membrane protein
MRLLIRVIRASNNLWYSEMIGEIFNVFLPVNSVYLFFSNNLYFYADDIEILKESSVDGLLPVFNTIGLA